MNLDNTYSFEIDFLPVGDGERSGDAIAMRYGYPEDYRVVVVDGGSKEAGERLVEHVRKVYNARHINLAVNTHPDADHASGLSVVLESFPVLGVWMHQPWNHPEAKVLFRNGAFTTSGLSARLREAVDAAYAVQKIADRRGIPVVEPFQGLSFGPLVVMSPTREVYLELIPHFERAPAAKYPSPITAFNLSAAENGIGLAGALGTGGLFELGRGALDAQRGIFGLGLSDLGAFRPHPASRGLLGGAVSPGLDLATSPKPTKYETWTKESLGESGSTSESNETSVVLYGRFNGRSILLTGDAGRRALLASCLYAAKRGIDLRQCNYYQVPHHGSRQNVSPTLLDLLLGPRTELATPPTRYAIASVAAGADDYPRKSVSNAFLRRGVSVCRTAGRGVLVQSGSFPSRWTGPSAQLPFYDVVDDPEE